MRKGRPAELKSDYEEKEMGTGKAQQVRAHQTWEAEEWKEGLEWMLLQWSQ